MCFFTIYLHRCRHRGSKRWMPLLRSWSRCRNWEQVFSLILSPFKQDKAMNFGQGPPDGFSGANKAATALLDSSYFRCAAFWDTEREVRIRTVPQAQKGLSHAPAKHNPGPKVTGLTGPSWASRQVGHRIPCSTWGLWAWDASSKHQSIPMDRFGGKKLFWVFSLITAAVCHVTGLFL